MEIQDVSVEHGVEKGLDENRLFIIMEYMNCNISRKELVKILGEGIVEEVDFIMSRFWKTTHFSAWRILSTSRFFKS